MYVCMVVMETHQSCLYFLHDWRTSSKRITCSASIRMADTHRLNPKTDRSKNRERRIGSAGCVSVTTNH